MSCEMGQLPNRKRWRKRTEELSILCPAVSPGRRPGRCEGLSPGRPGLDPPGGSACWTPAEKGECAQAGPRTLAGGGVVQRSSRCPTVGEIGRTRRPAPETIGYFPDQASS